MTSAGTRDPALFRIARLCDHPQALHAVAEIYRAVWPQWYGPLGPGRAEDDLADRCRADGLPIGLIALAGQQVAGAAALSATSFGAMGGEGPWLVGLAVDPAFRGQGIGTALIDMAERKARMQATWLYCTTTSAAGLLSCRGWDDLRRAGEGPDRVYRLTL